MAKWGFRGFDNRNPRDWLAKQQGWRARANGAQQNSWEALIVFAAAVLTAHYADAKQATVDTLALAFIALRVAYIALYVLDIATVRSLVWLAAYAAALGLFFVAA
jgi:uncharacterized MAPEG superfamily protein